MKNLLKKWNESSLVLRILGGLIIGVVLGLAVPQAAPIGLLGDLFVGALKAVAPLLADERFLQVGTSYLVNMLYVDSLEQDCFHMREGGRVPIPRLKRSMVRQCFLDFVLKRGLA